MYKDEFKIRVRYSETDKMGYVYYGNYSAYLEVARVEMLRNLGFTYKKMEDEGVMMPVVDFHITYKKPGYYDDLITIKTVILKMPDKKIEFEYEMFNEAGDLLNVSKTVLVFVDISTGKVCHAPEHFLKRLAEFFP